MKTLKVGDQARKEAVDALSLIAAAVGSTLGPQGRPFAFERLGADQRYKPTLSKDGLTVLSSLSFTDPIQNAVHHFAGQASASSVLASGDGTTSTIVFSAAVARMIRDTNSQLPQAFARQLRKEAALCIEAIKKEADKSDECVRKVALTSANNDEELVDVVLESIKKSSAYGTIVVEKSPASKERYKIVRQDGYVGARGYNYNNPLAYSCDDRAAESAPFEWTSPSVLCFNGHLLYEEQLSAILSSFGEVVRTKGGGQKLIIFAYEVSDEICNKLVVFNRTFAKDGNAIFVAKMRISAEINSSLQYLRDVAAFTNANIIDGGNYKLVTVNDLGQCGSVTLTPTQTILVGRSPNHWVDKRAKQNENIIASAESQFDREIVSIRNAELTEGLVKVEVGGGLMSDLQERADRFDDASKAAQSCMRSGALPGCGASYIRSGEIAGVSDEMKSALRVIHDLIMANYGSSPLKSFIKGQTVRISEDGVSVGDFKEVNVMDAAETVCAVIRNGVDLGVEVATIGGYSLNDQSVLSDIGRTRTLREAL
jgi:chaperonin GroEL